MNPYRIARDTVLRHRRHRRQREASQRYLDYIVAQVKAPERPQVIDLRDPVQTTPICPECQAARR